MAEKGCCGNRLRLIASIVDDLRGTPVRRQVRNVRNLSSRSLARATGVGRQLDVVGTLASPSVTSFLRIPGDPAGAR